MYINKMFSSNENNIAYINGITKSSASKFMSIDIKIALVSSGSVLYLDASDPASYPGTGTTWTDLSGSGNHGTIVSAPTFTTNYFTFDGTADYVYSTTSFVNPGPYTVSALFRTSSASGKNIVTFEGDRTGTVSSSYDRMLYMDTAGKIRFGNYDGNVDTAISTSTLNDNAWHYVAGTYGGEGTTMRLYVDGVSNATATSTILQNYLGYWRVGSYKMTSWTLGSDGYFSGDIGVVMVYHRSLSAAEILQNYQSLTQVYGF